MIRLQEIDSTQEYAKLHAREFAPHGITWIYADQQTKGKGRLGRWWVSPKGVNLYLTAYFRAQPFAALAQLMAWSLAACLLRHGLKPLIKWPNDVQLSGKKVAGVLCETRDEEIFLGIGVNVNMEPKELQAIGQPATSLKEETGTFWDREAVLQELIAQFEADWAVYQKEGFAPFRLLIEEHLAHKGKVVQCREVERVWEGVCDSLSPEGGLRLRLQSGEILTLFSGEIPQNS